MRVFYLNVSTQTRQSQSSFTEFVSQYTLTEIEPDSIQGPLLKEIKKVTILEDHAGYITLSQRTITQRKPAEDEVYETVDDWTPNISQVIIQLDDNNRDVTMRFLTPLTPKLQSPILQFNELSVLALNPRTRTIHYKVIEAQAPQVGQSAACLKPKSKKEKSCQIM